MDPALLEVLLGNLLKNAVRHNINEGSISVQLKKDHLEIENSGNSLTVPPDQLFERFRKDNQSSDSLGLGLSIVKKICDMNDIDISYKYEKERHIITVSFNALIK